MPQVVICIIAILAGIATFIFLLQTCTESQDKGYWGLWLAIAACLMAGMILWVNLDHDVPDAVYYTYTLERRDHTIYFIEDGKLKNATSIFGIDNIDADKQVIVKHGPATCWSYGRYMDLYVSNHTLYTLTDKMKP